MMPEGFQRCTKRLPCPVCGKPDWCIVRRDGTEAACKRVESPVVKGGCGWLHKIDVNAPAKPSRLWACDEPTIQTDWFRIMSRLSSDLCAANLNDEAATLGVSPEALASAGIGWHRHSKALAFPMRRADGAIVGIRFRHREGRKWAHTGSQSGLFFQPDTLDKSMPIYVCEGPTDRAALVDLGFPNAIARPSVDDGNYKVLQLARWWDTRPSVVVFRDNDEEGSQGHRAANKFLDDLARSRLFRSVRGVYPTGDAKDVRAWKQRGVSQKKILDIISDAMEWQISDSPSRMEGTTTDQIGETDGTPATQTA